MKNNRKREPMIPMARPIIVGATYIITSRRYVSIICIAAIISIIPVTTSLFSSALRNTKRWEMSASANPAIIIA